MSRRARLLLFGIGAAGFGVVLVYGLAGLPPSATIRASTAACSTGSA